MLIAAGDNRQWLRPRPTLRHLYILASLGNYHRHRLNLGGNRQANGVIIRIALNRLSWGPATKAYAERRTADRKSKREILRCLKRFIAREDYRLTPGSYGRMRSETECSVSLMEEHVQGALQFGKAEKN